MISFTPVNEEIAKKLKSLKILNGFIEKGFTERKAFIQFVMEECPALNNYKGMNKLSNFWASRDFSMNEQLEKVLAGLKTHSYARSN